MPGPRESQTIHKGTLVPNQQPPSVLLLILPDMSSLGGSSKSPAHLITETVSWSWSFHSVLFWGGNKEVILFHSWLPKLHIFCPQKKAQQRLLTEFCIQVQRVSLRISPILLLCLRITSFFFAEMALSTGLLLRS